MKEAAIALHQKALVIDSHNDSIVAHIRHGNVGLGGETGPDRASRAGAVAYLRQYLQPIDQGIQLDIPGMRRGGIDAAFFSVDVTRAWSNHLLYGMDALGYFISEVEEHPTDLTIAQHVSDIIEARREGKIAAVLGIENCEILERSPHILGLLYRLGVRTLTLTHSPRSSVGDGCEVENGSGLTGFGREVLAEMNALGMLVDISHLNEKGFWDVMKQSKAPVLASHSCCRALCDHPRNLRDDQLQALSENGGGVGITFVPDFLHANKPDFTHLLDHIDHAFEHAGADTVGLGSDFDGGGDLIGKAGNYPKITEGLMERGHKICDIENILGGNHLQILTNSIG